MSLYNVKCQYLIESDSLSVEEISTILGLTADHAFNKGDLYTSRSPYNPYPNESYQRPNTRWSVSTNQLSQHTPNLHSHLDQFDKLFRGKIDRLQMLKLNHQCSRTIWVWVETNEPLSVACYSAQELAFILSIADELVSQSKVTMTSLD